MPTRNKSKTQTKIMTTWLIALTGLSLVLVLLERVNIARHSRALAGESSQVAGEQIDNSSALENYRAVTRANFVYFQELAERKAKGESIAEDLTNLRPALLATPVPPIYQNLHFRIVRAASELENNPSDFLFLEEQARLLLEQYPWLN